jgi:hypothetical protein
MGWTVYSTDAKLRFSVRDSGLSVSGTGRHVFQPSAMVCVDMSEIDSLPAEWTIYRATEAYDAARLIGLDVSDMTSCVDPDMVKTTDKPICIISKSEEAIGFSVFLPDSYFFNTLELLKSLLLNAQVSYWFNFEFIGFLPQKVPGESEFFFYGDWLAGKPIRSDEFSFNISVQGTHV